MSELLAEVPSRVMAVYAHPDDPDVSSGATMARWSRAGAEVHVVLVARGDKGADDASVDADALTRERAGESASAARLTGAAAVHQLGRLDGEFENDVALRRDLVRLIRAHRPNVLLCPDPLAVFFGEHYYNHRDHRVVGFAALDAASPAAASPLYFPEQGAPWQVEVAYLSGSLEADVFVDVTETIAAKVDAVLCHGTQLGANGERFRPVLEARAAEAGKRAGVRYAEAFRRIRLASG